MSYVELKITTHNVSDYYRCELLLLIHWLIMFLLVYKQIDANMKLGPTLTSIFIDYLFESPYAAIQSKPPTIMMD